METDYDYAERPEEYDLNMSWYERYQLAQMIDSELKRREKHKGGSSMSDYDSKYKAWWIRDDEGNFVLKIYEGAYAADVGSTLEDVLVKTKAGKVQLLAADVYYYDEAGSFALATQNEEAGFKTLQEAKTSSGNKTNAGSGGTGGNSGGELKSLFALCQQIDTRLSMIEGLLQSVLGEQAVKSEAKPEGVTDFSLDNPEIKETETEDDVPF